MPSSKETTIAELEAHMERIAAKIGFLRSQPDDDFPEGAIITWDRQFDGKGRVYTYVAVKKGRTWYCTNSSVGRTWDEVLRIIGDAEVYYVTHMEQVI